MLNTFEKSKKKVLLIEDNKGDACLLSELLNDGDEEAYEIVHRERLKDGINYLESNDDINVVLLDLSLPDSTGFNTLSQIKSRNAHLPVIILTGSTLKRPLLRQCLDSAENYLVKGFIDSKSLKDYVNTAIDKKMAKERIEAYLSKSE